MDIQEEKTEERKEKIKNWLNQPLNLALVAVLLFAFVIRFHYFLMTKTQPLWWDGLCYGSLAKNFVSHAWDGTTLIIRETLIRPPLFPFLWSLLLRLNLSEVSIRFLLEFTPSVLAVFFIYLVGKEMYNKRVGIIAASILSVLWIHLFYTARLLTNIPALSLFFLSVYFFIKSQKNEFNPFYFTISLFLLSLSTLTRYPNGIIFIAFLFFLAITGKFSLIKKTKFWISGVLGLAPLIFFFIFNYITKDNIFPAFLGGQYVNTSTQISKPIAFHLVNFIPVYLKTVFFIFFIIGLVIALFEIFLSYDIINKKERLKGHLINLLILIIILSFFIFYMRVAEDRWLFAMSLPLACLTGIGMDQTIKFTRKYNQHIPIILIALILIFGAYQQITFADNLIKIKKESYLQMQQGFEWIKANTPEDSIILGSSISPYSIYYSERDYLDLPQNISEVNTIAADYLVVHSFTTQPEYINTYLQENQDKWQPINAFFIDEAKTQPIWII